MKRLIISAILVLTITSCGVAPLYNWGTDIFSDSSTYESLTYNKCHNQTPKSICDLIVMYQKLIDNPGGTRNTPPPGICAEYGYLLLNPETAGIFEENATANQKKVFDTANYTAAFRERGLEMLEKELTLYPESAPFLKPLLTKFQNQ